jgi:hypothetical protein
MNNVRQQERHNKQKLCNLFKNYELVSLGYNCVPKFFISSIKGGQTHLFDWVGSSMWSIYKIVADNFPVLTNYDELIPYKPGKNNQNIEVVTNKKYFIRFIHDIKHIKDINIMKDINNEIHNKYMRRSNRFKNLLMSSKSIVFFHVEENNKFRFDSLYTEIKPYYPDSFSNYHIKQSKISIEYAKKFMDLVINKYNRPNTYLILASNISKTEHIKEYNIIIINTMSTNHNIENYNHQNIGRKELIYGIMSNYELINRLINRLLNDL